MSIKIRSTAFLAYLGVTIGIIAGITGFVRAGALFIAVGAFGVSISRHSARRFERFLPLALAVALFILALALPRGR
ncbi:MAG: hypothetical protein WCO27_02865 [Actinomycetes bacterium]